MYKNLKKKSEGFTIIEVLIVLAIAALIMLIVFIAVPALRRNARNNEIRNNASRVATAVSEFKTNANGTAPVDGTDNTTIQQMANVTSTVTLTAGNPANIGDFNVVTTSGQCNGTTAAAGGPDARAVAVQFRLDGTAAVYGCIVS